MSRTKLHPSEFNYKKRICKECETPYQPRSSSGKHCPKCAELVKRKNHTTRQQRYRKRYPGVGRDTIKEMAHGLKRYGMTLDQYYEMSELQNNSCAICGETKMTGNNKHRLFVVDHCHETGKIRGLLCNNCNRGMGLLKDDEEVLLNVIKYLKSFKDKLLTEVLHNSDNPQMEGFIV